LPPSPHLRRSRGFRRSKTSGAWRLLGRYVAGKMLASRAHATRAELH
jgi:hypothetical protein